MTDHDDTPSTRPVIEHDWADGIRDAQHLVDHERAMTYDAVARNIARCLLAANAMLYTRDRLAARCASAEAERDAWKRTYHESHAEAERLRTELAALRSPATALPDGWTCEVFENTTRFNSAKGSRVVVHFDGVVCLFPVLADPITAAVLRHLLGTPDVRGAALLVREAHELACHLCSDSDEEYAQHDAIRTKLDEAIEMLGPLTEAAPQTGGDGT